MRKKILICSGGTGGHLYPALAIIEYIKDNYSMSEVLFIGTEIGLGKELIKGFDVNYKTVKSRGLALNGSIYKKTMNIIKFFYCLTLGFFQSFKIVLGFKPDIIMGMGGFSCAPVLTAGIFMGKKIALHEQNYIPGRLNGFFSKFAKYIFISFNDTGKYFKVRKSKIIFSGNPLRKAIRNLKNIRPEFEKWGLEKGRFTIVAFGGSLGAEKINDTVINLCDYFKGSNNIQILLICGNRFYSQLEGKRNNVIKSEDKLIFRIFPYIKEMQEIYKISDLIISRAGANTISEIIECNIPSILIPYPYAVANHQFHNADFLARKGKAILIEDKDFDMEKVIEALKLFVRDNGKKYKEMKNIEISGSGIDSAGIIISKLME